MIKTDWEIFKAKFSTNPQDAFEWMCYLLFCNEFHVKTGIFRYKNQSAIETNPISSNEVNIGWQAKFYDSALSTHKNDIIEMITKAKRDYPYLNKIIFYTNSEWGQNKGKEPQGKIEAEMKAKANNLEIEWRCCSFFESPFVVEDCSRITSYFFTRSDDLFRLLDSFEAHTCAILNDIETAIIFGDENVSINRSDIISEIESSDASALIISGEGGTGKTSLIKEIYGNKGAGDVFYVHKATEFSVSNLNEFLSGVFLKDFIEAHDGVDSKTVVIDSAEHLIALENTNPIKEYLSTLIKAGWKVWFTTRNTYLDDLIFQLYEVYKISFKSVHLENLNESTLFELAKKHEFAIPNDKNFKAIILTPFYLREYLRHYQENKSASYFEFKESLWPRVITKRSPQREQFFIHLAEERANSGRFFVIPDPSYSNETVEKALVSDGIISYESTRGYFITHDIYEEWALDKFVESNFLSSENAEIFFDRIQQSLPIRRVFRRWLSEKLSVANEEVSHLIVETLSSCKISNLWKDEVLVSMLLSDYSDYFFSVSKDSLLEDNFQLLKRICLLIRIGCKEIDNSFFDRLGLRAPDILSMEYVITKPKGNGWNSLVKFIKDNLEEISANKLSFVLPVLYDWNCHNKTGDTTKYSSIIALSIYKSIIEDDIYVRDTDFSKNLILTILYGVSEIKSELENVIDEIVLNGWNQHNDPYNLMSEFILTKMECFNVSMQMPEKVIALAKCFWIHNTSEANDYLYGSKLEIDHEFGIEDGHFCYFPASAYQSPIYTLLQTLDVHYADLIDKKEESPQDKTWRLYLARMDKRKMSPEVKEVENGVTIEFNPEIAPELQEYSETSLRETRRQFKYFDLNIWADGRLHNRNNYKNYRLYEENPLTALSEAKKIWIQLLEGNTDEASLFYRATPSHVCAVLLRDFQDKLAKTELELCREVIFAYANMINNDAYIHQIGDGVVPALFVLPRLITYFPDERLTIKLTLIKALMRNDPISIMGMDKINSVVIQAVLHLWDDEPDFMKSLYIGYLVVSQKYRDVRNRLRQEAYKQQKYEISDYDFRQELSKQLEGVVSSIEDETITKSAINDIKSIDNDILITAFQLVPLNGKNKDQVLFTEEIVGIISKQLLSRNRKDRIDYALRIQFLKHYTRFVLHLDNSEKGKYLKFFIDDFTLSEGMADLLNEFISTADSLNKPDSFWYVWSIFKGKIIDSMSNQDWKYHKERIIESFLFARVPWKDEAKTWHTFSPQNKNFFSDLSSKIGGESSFMYSICKLLCGIGSEYLDDGIYWVSHAIKTFDIELPQEKSENTLFFLERYMRRYLSKNHDKVRRTPNLKAQSMVVLDFLVEQYSITGYLLREDIA